MRITLLSDWYPDLYRRWRDDGRRYTVPVGSRTGWTVHHTAGGDTADPLAYARWVGDWHFDKWARPGGYNFFIPTDGTILEMCGWRHVGAHAPGCNRSTFGVCFQGTFTDRLPNDDQLAAFAYLLDRRPVPIEQQGHRDCSSTSCPGDALYRALPLPTIEEDDLTPDDRKMLRSLYKAIGGDPDNLGGDNDRPRDLSDDARRLRFDSRARGRALGLKVDVNGQPGQDIVS